MPAPQSNVVARLGYVLHGAPWGHLSNGATVNTLRLAYVLHAAPFTAASADAVYEPIPEALDAVDEWAATATVEGWEETLGATDEWGSTGPVEALDAQDDWGVKVGFEETLPAVDEWDFIERSPFMNEALDAQDDWLVNFTQAIGEALDAQDTWSVNEQIAFTELLGSQDTWEIIRDRLYLDTVKLEISHIVLREDTVNVAIGPIDLAPVTDPASLTNPFLPTISVAGSYIVQNPGTDPGLGDDMVTISLDDTGLLGGATCTMVTFSLQLDEGGGSFSFETTTLATAKGATISLFGLIGYVTKAGRRSSSSGNTYLYEGIFSRPELSLPLQQLAQASIFSGLTANQRLSQPFSSNWQSAASIAQALAASASISLTWMAQDATVTDMLPESNGTALSAIQSLADRVGARLVWHGTNRYVVCYPDQPLGTWVVPSCELLLPSGCFQLNWQHLPARSIIWPVETASAAQTLQGFEGSVTSPAPAPKVEGCGGLSFRPEEGVVKLFPLDADYDVVYTQIICPSSGAGTYVTTDASGDTWSQWGGQVITKKDRTRWIRVTRADLPDEGVNDDIDDGNFSMNFGFTRKRHQPEYEAARQERNAQETAALSEDQNQIRFVQDRNGAINAVFFGSLPMPGMTVEAIGGDGVLYQGRASSVSCSYPGTISVTFERWKRLFFYQPRSIITTDNAGG